MMPLILGDLTQLVGKVLTLVGTRALILQMCRPCLIVKQPLLRHPYRRPAPLAVLVRKDLLLAHGAQPPRTKL